MLWIPGPTHVRPELERELCAPMIGHRSSEMSDIVARLDPHLRIAFGAEAAHVAAHTSSATGLMEASLVGAGERVLNIVGGAFARRWAKITELRGMHSHVLEVPAGEVVSEGAIATALSEHGPFDAMTLVVNETSTGVLTDPAIAARARTAAASPETQLFVDVVSAVAGMPLAVDADGIDFALAGVNKALALPPGIAVCAVSERYLERARTRPKRGFYLDPVRIVEGHEARKTPTTPSISLYRALARQLEDISAGVTLPEDERRAGLTPHEAWQARFRVHERMRDRTLEWARTHGLEPFPVTAGLSPTVACIRAGSIDVPSFVSGLAERGEQIGAGYGDLKKKTFRIGHMGDHLPAELDALLATADEVLSASVA